MEIIYVKTPFWDEKMESGLFGKKISELHIHCQKSEVILTDLKKLYKTNLDIEQFKLSELDILIWVDDDEPDLLQITFNSQFAYERTQVMVESIIRVLKNHDGVVKEIKIFRDCEIVNGLVKDFISSLFSGNVVENIIANTARLCLVDSTMYLGDEQVKEMVNRLESLLFAEIVDKKIRMNGKPGVLKEVNDPYGRFGFFERGVKKNYVFLSLVQKMGTKTIREISISIGIGIFLINKSLIKLICQNIVLFMNNLLI